MEKSAGEPDSGGSDSDAESNDAPIQQSPPVLLETLSDRVPEPAVTLDSEALIAGVNGRFEAAVGMPSSLLLGEPFSWLFPDVDLGTIEGTCDPGPRAEYVTAQCARLEDDAWFELTFDRHEWDDETAYFGIVRDVTDRHERRQLLEQYERIVETIEDGIYTLDESFTIETVNSAVESMTGYSKETLLGSSAMILADETTLDEAARISSEILSGQREAGTLTTTLRTADGSTLPIETRFTTYDLGEGFRQVGVVRDISDRKRFERTLADLHEATRQLLHTETRESVASHVVKTASEVLELPAVAVYLFDRSANELRPIEGAGTTGDDATSAEPVEPGEGFVWDVFVGDEAVAFGPETDLGLSGCFEGDSSGLCLPLDDHGVFCVCTPTDRDDHVRELIELLTASTQAAFARVDRESALREREAELRERNSELQQLKQVNEIIRRIDRVLVDAETREAVERAVCDQLVDSNLFSFAWIGRADGSELVARAWAGDAADYLDSLSLSIPDDGPPAVDTVRSESMTVVESIADNLHDERWRTEALSRGFQSAISVPLQYEEFVYGVVTVYADRPSAFGEKLQSVFVELCETIANAIQEVESRQRQAPDSVLELELRLSGSDSFVRRLATALDATVHCDGAVPYADGATRLFVRIEDCDPETVRRQAESMVSVESISVISTDGSEGRYEVISTGPTIAGTLLDLTAQPGTIRSTPTETAVTAQLATDVDVRTVVERFQQRYPDTELIARRERTVTDQTSGGIRPALEDRLTERQFEVLKTAYLSGFFDWPRESTGQDVASMLDVSQPTVNRHLRVSERSLLDLVFDGI